MKTTKKTITKKTVKPVYTVDISNCEDANDILLAFANAKQKAGLPITDEELECLINENSVMIIVENVCEVKKKKLPWYKLFWNWVTRKK